MKGVLQTILVGLMALSCVACGSNENASDGSTFKSTEAADAVWILDNVDGEAVTAADAAELQFQAEGEILIQDVNDCSGVIPVIASQEGRLSLGKVRTRGCHIDYLISSNQLTLATALRAGEIPFEEVDTETLVIKVDEKLYTFHRQ